MTRAFVASRLFFSLGKRKYPLLEADATLLTLVDLGLVAHQQAPQVRLLTLVSTVEENRVRSLHRAIAAGEVVGQGDVRGS